MKRLRTILLPAAVAAGCFGGSVMGADSITSSTPKGYVDRAELMATDHNPQGVFDQTTFALPNLPTNTSEASTALLLQGASALQGGNYETARRTLERYLDLYPASAERWKVCMLLADIDFANKDYTKALRAYDAIDDRVFGQSDLEDLVYRRGYCRLMLGDYKAATAAFGALSGTSRYGNAAEFYKAYIAYAQGDYTKAHEGFLKVDQTGNPGSATPYYLMQLDFAEGNYGKAFEQARDLINNPTIARFTPEANRIAGESLYNLGKKEDAAPYLWKYAATVDMPSPSTYYILGYTEYEAGNWDNAIMLMQSAISAGRERNQQSQDGGGGMVQSAYLILGQAYLQRGDKDNALMAFEQAYRQNYDRNVQETAFYNYAVARTSGGRVPFGSSVGLLEDFLKEFPNSQFSGKVREYVVNGYMTDNDYTAALAAIERDPSPEKPVLDARQRVLFELGSRYCQAGRYPEAERLLTSAIDMGEGYDNSIRTQSRQWLGDCLLERGDYAAATRSLETYLAETKDDETIPYNRMIAAYDLGYARMGQADREGAITAFRQAEKSANRLGDAALRADIANRIGDCKLYSHDFAGACEAYARAYDVNPSAGDYALYSQALAEGLRGRHGAKISGMDNLLSRFPTTGLAPNALLEKAESQLAIGDKKGAVQTYKDLINGYPATAPGRNGWLQLAMFYMNEGKRSDAIDAYKQVIMRYPSSEEARLATDDLKRVYASEGRTQEFAAFLSEISDAPQMEASDIELAAFDAAETAYATEGKTALVEKYLKDYPEGMKTANALYMLAESAWNAGNAKQAIKQATRIVNEYPDSEVIEDALMVKGEAERSIGKTEPALNTFQILEDKASTAAMKQQARMGILRTAVDLGRDAEALKVADELLKSTTGTPETTDEVNFLRAQALNHSGNVKEADRILGAMAENPANLYGSMSAVALGENLLERGDLNRAFSVTDKFINANPPHQYWLARGFIVYSDILRKQGKTFEADEYLKSLRSNYPGGEADIIRMIDERIGKK